MWEGTAPRASDLLDRMHELVVEWLIHRQNLRELQLIQKYKLSNVFFGPGGEPTHALPTSRLS